MASKKQSKTKASSSHVREKNRSIWGQTQAQQWLTFLQANDPEHKPWKLKGATVTGHCRADSHPGEDEHPSMHIVVEKGFVKCFACGYFESDPLRFVQLVTKRSIPECAKEMQTSFGVKLLSVGEMRLAEEEFKHLQMKAKLANLFKHELVECYQAWLQRDTSSLGFAESEYAYSEDLLKYLDHRKVLHNCMHIPVGILPAEYRLKKIAANLGYSGHDIAAMTKYLKEVLVPFYTGSLVFIYNSSPRDVSRFRLRRPGVGESKNIIMIDDPREDFMGWFGLQMYLELVDKKEGIGAQKRFLAFEGEFDLLQYASGQIDSGNFDWVGVAHGGSTNHQLRDLKNFGLEECYYVPDLDAGGDNNAKDILIENPELQVRIFNWPDGILVPGGKTDIDDSIKLYGWDTVNKELSDLEYNWSKPELWCKEQVKKVVREKRLEGDDLAISKQVFSYAPCIGDMAKGDSASAIRNWTQGLLAELGIAVEQAQKFANDFLAKESAETVFYHMLRQALVDNFEFICVDPAKASLPMLVLNKKKRELFELRLGNDAHVKASLGVAVGRLSDWVQQEVSIPDFIKYAVNRNGEAVERSIPSQEEDLLRYFQMALRDLSSKLPLHATLERYADGCHWLHTGTSYSLFIVNGKHVFRCWFEKDGDIHWEELDSPLYGKYLFDTTLQSWSKTLSSLDKLVNAPKVELRDLVTKVADILAKGWTFKCQETESLALAAFIVSSCVLKVFPQNLQFLAANERGCGKSTLYAELIGGGKGTDLNLVEHSRFVDNATPAGIRQMMNGSSRILILDEFDNTRGSRFKAEKMEEIFTILRCCSAGEGLMLQGSQSGEAKVFRLSFSSMIAGIDPNVSDANMTRFFTTDLQSGLDSRPPPRTSILENYSVDELDQLKQLISLSVFRYIPALQRSLNHVRSYIHENEDLMGGVIQRFKDSMSLIMAVLHAADMDWIDWCKKTVKSKSSALATLKTLTMNDSLVSNLLYTSAVEVGDADNKQKLMVSQFFTTGFVYNRRAELNSSGCGAYLYHDPAKDRWYLLVVWQQAVQGVLKGSPIVKNKDEPSSLKNIGDRHELALKEHEVNEVFSTVSEIPAVFRNTPVTIFDVSSFVLAEIERSKLALEQEKKKLGTNVKQLHA